MQKIKLTAQDIDNQCIKFKEQLMGLDACIMNSKGSMTWDLKITEPMPKVTVTMTGKAYDKMMSLVLIADKEIGWHGIVTKQDDLHYTIVDIVVFPQEVTGASVRPPADEYIAWLTGFPRDIRTAIKFHGHSHVNMGTSPSSTDTKYQEDIVKQMEDGTYIFFIVNKKNDIFARVYDVDNNLVYETADIDLVAEFQNSTLDWANTQIKEQVKEEVRTTYTYANQKNTALTTWERERMKRLEAQGKQTVLPGTTPSTAGKNKSGSNKGYGKPGRPTLAEVAARKAEQEQAEQAAQVDNMVREYHKATPGSPYEEYMKQCHPELYGY